MTSQLGMKLEKWHSCILDIIDIKLFKLSHAGNNKTKKCPKGNFTVMLCNKGMEQINPNRIIKSKGSITRLAEKNTAPRKYSCGYIEAYTNNKKQHFKLQRDCAVNHCR